MFFFHYWLKSQEATEQMDTQVLLVLQVLQVLQSLF